MCIRDRLQAVQTMIASIEKRIIVQHRSNEASKRLRSIPGIGLVGATALVATITDPKAFRCAAMLNYFRQLDSRSAGL